MKYLTALSIPLCAALAACAAVTELPNGDVWKDTDGVMINAHGGALMQDGDTWYWYGEHKTAGKEGNKAWVGVSCYSSKNLLDWKNEGTAFKVATAEEVAANPKLAGVEAGCILERPKVIRAQDGSRYVMYFHLEPKGQGYGGAQTGIAESKTPTGPFTLVWNGRPNAGDAPQNVGENDREAERTPWGNGKVPQWRRFRDGGQMSRDMTLYADPKDGTVYHIFASEENSCLHLAEVKADGLGYTGRWWRMTPGDWTEAPAVVKNGDWYYLIGSGCTGWRPNAARYYRAKSIQGPWERMGNPCRGGKDVEITWRGQSTGIFTVNGTSFAMFDQWRPWNAIDGRYVWVPISFTDRGTMTIDWRETFTPQLAVPWEDEYVSEMNRLPARTPIRPLDSRWTLNLDGEWDFTFVNSVSEVGPTPRREVTPGTSRPDTITVPSCWQVEGVRRGKAWDPPLYTNARYPIAYDPPRVMTAPQDKSWTSDTFRNPRGIYRKRVTLPAGWQDRKVTLRLMGYSSAVYVRVNGKAVGYGEDGRLPNEFDLTPALTTDNQPLATAFDLELEVLKHCDGTYLEDQDFWRLNGLFRSVMLVSEPKDGLFDFTVKTRVAGTVGSVSVQATDVEGHALPVTWRLFGTNGDELSYGTGADEVQVPKVQLWSGAKPNLYRVRVQYAGEEYERRFGFRTVSIDGNVLKLNGERVVFHGVNRHEMSPTGGYTVTREEMKKDIELLKKFNINAVRTSHYPNHPDWYDLCDENGILVVAEANIECHGSGHPMKTTALSHIPSWRKSFVERNLNQVAVLRDHPSIIAWSLGNESGNGANMIAAYEAVKLADPTRPCQYEGVMNPYHQMNFGVYGSDIICPMYETPEKVERAMQKGFKKPYILCEYSHAMGNSNGNFDEYMALIEKYPSFQGGFIWDFADQALLVDGKLRYGGDFGDKPNDRHGHCNGLFDALRNPHPGAYEVGYWYGGRREVKVEGVGVGVGRRDSSSDLQPPTFNLSLWRAPTDNDRGNKLPRRADVWKKATETGVLPEGVTTNLVVTKTEKGCAVDFTLTVPDGLPELPRVGLMFEVEGSPETRVAWHGAGPHENYSDRKASAAIGEYAMTVAELNDSGYIRPQECGHRTATDRLVVGGVTITGNFEWNVQPWTVFDQEKAGHAEELPAPDGKLRVYLDAAMRGVGGDDSWGADVHEPYRLEGARTYRLKFSVRQ